MTVMVIDDQVNVVNGIVHGVDWEKLHIDTIYTANSAEQAKRILKKEHIDIMLCDIEMPGDDGLSLFRWAREYDERIECIFLTAHADFQFAKEALRLGSFDYILQPAPYKDIEDALQKAILKVRSKIENLKYSSYGKSIWESKSVFLEGFLKEWFLGSGLDIKNIIENLSKFQIHLTADTSAVYCILQILNWEEKNVQLESSLLKYAFSNILSELLEQYHAKVILAQTEKDNYGILLYEENADVNYFQQIPYHQIKKMLEKFVDLCSEFYGCNIACYLSEFVSVNSISEQFPIVKKLQKNNVMLSRGVFCSIRNFEIKYQEKIINMDAWPRKLASGETEDVREEALRCLNNKNWNFDILKQFYMEFMQSVFKACEQSDISNYEIFEEKGNFEEFLNAYHSVDTMKKMVLQVTDYFHKQHIQNDDNYVENIIQYIHSNIERDIQRKDLAALVNLNEDYLSRIFKREKGISLKEYIILEKMRTAQNLLINTNFSISMIGSKVGFDNFSYFSQTYKKIMGKTPTEERDCR